MFTCYCDWLRVYWGTFGWWFSSRFLRMAIDFVFDEANLAVVWIQGGIGIWSCDSLGFRGYLVGSKWFLISCKSYLDWLKHVKVSFNSLRLTKMAFRYLNVHFGSLATGLFNKFRFLRANLLCIALRTAIDSMLLFLSWSTSRFLNCSMPWV